MRRAASGVSVAVLVAGPWREPLHPPTLLVDGDERHELRIGVGEIGGEEAELPGRADILRIKHHAADRAFGELVAHGLDPLVVLVCA